MTDYEDDDGDGLVWIEGENKGYLFPDTDNDFDPAFRKMFEKAFPGAVDMVVSEMPDGTLRVVPIYPEK